MGEGRGPRAIRMKVAGPDEREGGTALIYVGASGYSYEDWVGPFYPPGLPKNRFLEHYALKFGAVEVNYTYYRMPTAATLAAMCRKTGPDFRFTVKAPGDLTHKRCEDKGLFDQFREALRPLEAEGKLGCVLAQFPFSFKPSAETREYLAGFRTLLPDLPVVVELRNAQWVSRGTINDLRRLGLGFCCVDEPRLEGLMPPIAGATAKVGYIRLHGRNAAKWFTHQEAWERYDYLYSDDELREWLEPTRKVAAQAEDTYVFFNNHYNAQAVQNAGRFVELLQEADLAG